AGACPKFRHVDDVGQYPTYEVHRRLELVLGLARKTDDDVGGKRELRIRLAKPVDDFLKLGHGVLPTHRLQNPIGSALHREVQELEDFLRRISPYEFVNDYIDGQRVRHPTSSRVVGW